MERVKNYGKSSKVRMNLRLMRLVNFHELFVKFTLNFFILDVIKVIDYPVPKGKGNCSSFLFLHLFIDKRLERVLVNLTFCFSVFHSAPTKMFLNNTTISIFNCIYYSYIHSFIFSFTMFVDFSNKYCILAKRRP